jgi:hypothetical protein
LDLRNGPVENDAAPANRTPSAGGDEAIAGAKHDEPWASDLVSPGFFWDHALDQVNVRAVENKAIVEHRDSDGGAAA